MTTVVARQWAYLAGTALLFASPISLLAQANPAPSTSQSAAQQSDSPVTTNRASTSPTFKANTRYVLVDVIAQDKKGRPVSNLAERDFDVSEKIGWVQKVPEKIAVLRYVDKTRLRDADRASASLVETPAGVYSNLAAVREPDGPLTVILLDSLDTDLSGPDIRKQVTDMFADVHLDGPVAIMLLDARLYMLQDFTADRNISRATLDKFFSAGPFAMLHLAQATAPSLEMQNQFGVAASNSHLPVIQDWSRLTDNERLDARVQLTMDGLRAIARHLAGYPGRKKLIWVSGSFPLTILPDPSNPIEDSKSYKEEIAAVTDALSDARVAVYPIRPGGLWASDVFSASRKDRPVSSRGGAYAVAEAFERQSLTQFAMDSNMEEFASDTGGEACIEQNELAGCLERDLKEGFSYYELGYYPPAGSWKEGFHRIVIRPHRSGVRLLFRRGYYAGTEKFMPMRAGEAGGRIDPGLRQAACDDVMAATALPLRVRPVATNPRDEVDYAVTVDGKLLTTIPKSDNPDSIELHLDFAACVFDANGKPLQYMQYPREQELSRNEYASLKEHGFRRVFEFHPVPGVRQVRWVVRDQLAGSLGSVDVPFQTTSIADSRNQSVATSGPTTTSAVMVRTSDQSAPADPKPQGDRVLPASVFEQPKGSSEPQQMAPQSTDEPAIDVDSYCSALGSTTKSPEALSRVCKFVLTLSTKLPNIICQRQTTRFWRANGVANRDLVVSKVAYFDDIEHDGDVIETDANGPGHPSEVGSSLSGGEFSGDLQEIFSPSADASFKFVGTGSLRSTPALVLQFHVDRDNNHLYQMHARYANYTVNGKPREVTDFPGYRGEIWLDKSTFQLLRLVRQTTEMAPRFPITHVENVIDYANTPLGDGTSFVLPTHADMTSCMADEGDECAHNIVSFVDYHKFGSTTKILSGDEQH